MKWAGGAGRRDGVHMVHTFEEVRTRNPADPNKPAPEAIMPQAAWEALLRDAVQGLRPPYTPRALLTRSRGGPGHGTLRLTRTSKQAGKALRSQGHHYARVM